MAGDLGSTQNIRLLYVVIHYLLPSLSKKEIIHLAMWLRKVGHFLAYAALFYSYVRAWRWHMRRPRLQAIVLALALCLLISLADEGRQALYNSRSGSPWDVALDMSGALTATVTLFPFLREEDRQRELKL
jgi:VanZ family protein